MLFASGRYSRSICTILAFLAAAPTAFAGKEFSPGPHDQVAPDQLLVGLQLGADINQILRLLAPQVAATALAGSRNVYLLKLPPGIQAFLSSALAAHPLVNYVEP